MNYSTPKKVSFAPPTVINYYPDAPVMHRARSFTSHKVGGYIKVLSPSQGGVFFIRDLLPAMDIQECEAKSLFPDHLPKYMRLVKIASVDVPRFMDIRTTWDEVIYMLTEAYKFPLVERSTPFEYGPTFCNYDPANDDFEMMFKTITVRNHVNAKRNLNGRENPMQYDPIFADVLASDLEDLPLINTEYADDIVLIEDWFNDNKENIPPCEQKKFKVA